MKLDSILYWFSAALFCVLLVFQWDTIDISLHDTYFVIDFRFILIFFTLLFGLFGLISFLLRKKKIRKKKMNRVLFWIHWIGSIALPVSWILSDSKSPTQNQFDDYSVYDEFNSSSFDFNQILTILVLLFILCQIVFLINLISTLLKKSH